MRTLILALVLLTVVGSAKASFFVDTVNYKADLKSFCLKNFTESIGVYRCIVKGGAQLRVVQSFYDPGFGNEILKLCTDDGHVGAYLPLACTSNILKNAGFHPDKDLLKLEFNRKTYRSIWASKCLAKNSNGLGGCISSMESDFDSYMTHIKNIRSAVQSEKARNCLRKMGGELKFSFVLACIE